VKLEHVVPWGRSLDEYRLMFRLSDSDLNKRILGCSDGPASFNAQTTAFGGQVVSVDPIYQFTAWQIRSRIDEVYPEVMEQMAIHADDYVWKQIPDLEQLSRVRMGAMATFLADYHPGLEAGRYVHAMLPELPFDDHAFELALCSHFLFLYSEQVDLALHIRAMKELCRVAREVRVYPLVALDGRPSPHVGAVTASLRQSGIEVCLQPVEYEFQKGAVEMLVATSGSVHRS